MSYFVLGAWLIQSAVGVALLAGWLTHGRHNSAVVLPHVGLSVGGLGLWVAFLATDQVAWGWLALGLITVGNSFGDYLLVGRSRQLGGTRSSFFKDYGAAISAVFKGRLPKQVTFHASFAGVVYFTALGACIIASRS